MALLQPCSKEKEKGRANFALKRVPGTNQSLASVVRLDVLSGLEQQLPAPYRPSSLLWETFFMQISC